VTRPAPSDVHPQPFDVGLQTERTLLAWRRTCLSTAGISAAAVRFTVADIGVVAVFVGGAAFALSVAAWVVATYRYRRVHRSLTAGRADWVSGGSMVAVTAVATILMAVLAIVILFVI
jgi:uncharacterized membrane protein YidH (DUF202 family)